MEGTKRYVKKKDCWEAFAHFPVFGQTQRLFLLGSGPKTEESKKYRRGKSKSCPGKSCLGEKSCRRKTPESENCRQKTCRPKNCRQKTAESYAVGDRPTYSAET